MKNKLLTLFALALAPAAFSDDYTVFRVCQDKHVIKTSDGAEGGHVEYVVIEPSSHTVVSTVVTGGIVGEKFVAVPYESLQFGGERDIVLREITRERLVSAPVIEKTRITSSTRIQSNVFEETSRHFGVRFDASVRAGDHRDTEHGARINEPGNDRNRPPGANANENRGTAETNRNAQPGRATTDPNQTDRNTPQAGRPGQGRAATNPGNDRNANQPPNERNRPEPVGEKTPERTNPKDQSGHDATTPQPGRESATPQPGRDKNAAERSQGKTVRPGEETDRDKAQGSKAGEKPDSATDKSREKAEQDGAKSAEKSDRATDKAQEKSDRATGKSEEKGDRPPQKSESEKRPPESRL